MSRGPQAYYEGMDTQRRRKRADKKYPVFTALAPRPFAFLAVIVLAAVVSTTSLRLLSAVLDADARLTSLSLLVILLMGYFLVLVTYQGVPRGFCEWRVVALLVSLVVICFFWGPDNQHVMSHLVALVAFFHFTSGLGDYVVNAYVESHPALSVRGGDQLRAAWNGRWSYDTYVRNAALLVVSYVCGLTGHYFFVARADLKPLQSGLGMLALALGAGLLASRHLVAWKVKHQKNNEEARKAVAAYWTVIHAALTRSPDPFRPQLIRREHVATWFFGAQPLALLLCIFVAATVPAAAYFPVTLLSSNARLAIARTTIEAENNKNQESSTEEQPLDDETIDALYRSRVNETPEAWLASIPRVLVANSVLISLTLLLSVALSVYVPMFICLALCFSLIGPIVLELHTIETRVFSKEEGPY